MTDEELPAAQQEVARQEGAFVCPEGAACFAAAERLRESGGLRGGENVIVLNTGSGLKYPETVPVDVPTLPAQGRTPPSPR